MPGSSLSRHLESGVDPGNEVGSLYLCTICVHLPTGYGKSLIFQCLPIAADALFEKPRGSSVLVVISPLRSLMEDQIRHVNNMGVPAIAITDEEDVEIIQQVMNGNCVLVYGSPECLLSTESWRSIFDCQSVKEMLIGVAMSLYFSRFSYSS